jgi:cytochrome P450
MTIGPGIGQAIGHGIGRSVTLEELERDPYPTYARLRDEEPVSFVPAVGLWLVTRHDDVKHVATHPETFTAATDPSTLNRTMGENMLGMEGPEQRWIRAITEVPFRPRDVEERTQGMIPRLAGALIDGFVERGEADLFREYADPMSVRALCFMLGLDDVPWQDILHWNEGLMPGLANFEGDREKQAPADEAAAALHAAIGYVLDRLEREPDGSVLSWMLHHEEEGRRMSREQIVANTTLMLSGGLQEPRDVIALTLWALLSNPSQFEEVRADRALVKAAVEETLRWAGPVGTATRQTTEATELAGIALEPGALIGAVLSSANRDPRRWTDPDRFDVHRKEGAHLAFSAGPHFCLGAWFGRHLARVTLDHVLDRLPGLELDVERPVTLSGWEFRAPDSLWVRWQPQPGGAAVPPAAAG